MLDCTGKANVLSAAVMGELKDAIDDLVSDDKVKAIAVLSGKPDTFCAGADVHEIVRMAEQAEACQMSRQGQIVLSMLNKTKKPTVAGIHGSCLGGGLELALWCHARIATDDPSTLLALPEVRLGIIPGLGGTQLLTGRVGLKPALEMILSSEPVNASRALELALVDEVVSPDDLVSRVEELALSLVGKPLVPVSGGWLKYAPAEAFAAARPAREELSAEKQKSLFAMMERSVRIKTKGKYPAHTKVLSVMQEGLASGVEAGLELEAQTFGELAVGEVAKNLIFLFFASEFAKRSAASLAKKFAQGRVGTIGILGGGTMGASIAQLAATAGFDVLIKEANADKLQEAMATIATLFQRSGQKSKQGADETEAALKRVRPAENYAALAGADLIMEAVFEDVGTKAAVLREVAAAVGPDCILATNTSSLSVSEIAAHVPGNQRFLGIHFFHPVDKMPLVEIISHAGTSKDVVAKAIAFAAELDKTPVAVSDGPGFLVNRLLCGYIVEAARLSEELVPMNWIEEAAIDFGMPMGPLAVLDEVGLNVAFKVADVLHEGCGERYAPPAVIGRVKDLGLTGKRTGTGIYLWDESGKRLSFNPRLIDELGLVVSDEKPTPEQSLHIVQRLILPMIDEAARCLEEKVVRKPREIDLAMIMGIGFPAFRGGPLHYADSLGMPAVRARLEQIYIESGPQRQVCELILSLEAQRRRFYAGSDDGDSVRSEEKSGSVPVQARAGGSGEG